MHGVVGAWSLLAVGLFASGIPNAAWPETSLLGQLAGAGVFLALGFVPGWAISFALARAGALRVPPHAEVLGADLAEIPATPHPEGIPATEFSPDLPRAAAPSAPAPAPAR